MITTRTIHIKNNKALEILKSLENIDFIEFIDKESEMTQIKKIKKRDKKDDEDFFGLAGIWKDRDITIESIREKAWKRR